MLRVRQVKVKVEEKDKLQNKVASKLGININNIKSMNILKESIDARKKPEIYYVYEVALELDNYKDIKKNDDVEVYIEEKYELIVTKKLEKRPIIVGSGPAGLFAAYMLASYGFNPVIIERGEKIEDRIKSVEDFWNFGKLNLNSNVQFGEGGAGTFSDGKLNTLVKDKENRCKKVFEIFVENGAPKDILYVNKPHIGTDLLRNVIINMRNRINSFGGKFLYNTTFTDLIIEDNALKGIVVNNCEKLYTDTLILAIGHSARDTFEMLYKNKLNMSSKPFAIGIRIMHPQDMINKSQYGDNKLLPPASYKLTHKCSNGRGVYSFCMCPGGFVVNASSEEKRLVINGMSNHDRDEKCANSAIVVTVSSKDFGDNPLSGIEFQRQLENKAYNVGDGNIPIQLYKDFKNNTLSNKFGEYEPVIKGNYKFSNINDIFPKYICESLVEAIDSFGTKIKNFNRDDAIISAIESRTSSPVRIERDDNFESNIKGIYPIGEGAGYAGGITTSAIDGLKVVEKLLKDS